MAGNRPVGSPNPPELQQLGFELERLGFRLGPPEHLRFWRGSDESGYIALAPNRLSVHHFRPYPSWACFSGIINEVAKAYQDLLKPTKIQRIGLRYINDIDLGQTSYELEESFNFYPFVGQDLPQTLTGFQCLVQCDFEDDRDSLTLKIAAPPQTSQVVLDLDYFLAQPDRLQLDETADWLEQAHSNLLGVFEGCLKDPTRKSFYEKG